MNYGRKIYDLRFKNKNYKVQKSVQRHCILLRHFIRWKCKLLV